MTARPHFQCIVCDRQLEACFVADGDDDTRSGVYDGALFQAYGSFGCTLFDPSPSSPQSHLEIVVCDWCLQRKAGRVRMFMKDETVGSFTENITSVHGPGPEPSP